MTFETKTLVMVGIIMLLIGTSVVNIRENQELRATIAATQETGYLGNKFSVQLPDGRVVIAGMIMSQQTAKDFYYEHRIGYDSVIWRISNEKSVYVFSRSRPDSTK